jgi:mono/diheme cytochrome c family protein
MTRWSALWFAVACDGSDDEETGTTGETGEFVDPTPSTGLDRVPTILALDGDPDAGAQTFVRICAYCHGSDGLGTLSAPSLVDRLAGNDPPGSTPLDDEDIVNTVLLGKGNMDAYDRTLTNQEIADVAAYVRGSFGG